MAHGDQNAGCPQAANMGGVIAFGRQGDCGYHGGMPTQKRQHRFIQLPYLRRRMNALAFEVGVGAFQMQTQYLMPVPGHVILSDRDRLLHIPVGGGDQRGQKAGGARL